MPVHTIKRRDLEPYLSGRELLGDDASAAELKDWFQQEVGGYAGMAEEDTKFEDRGEVSAALNRRHFGRHLKGKKDLVGLVYGPADATELRFINHHFKNWKVVEPGKIFQNKKYYTKPVTFLPVTPKGALDLPDASVDVVICLSVLHHIANVSYVLGEIARVLKPNGLLFVREPTVTMGEWGSHRQGLTANERGLPLPWLLKACRKQGLEVAQALPAVFAPLDRFVRLFGVYAPYASRLYMAFDSLFSTITLPLARYYRPKWWQRFAPAAVLLVARKPEGKPVSKSMPQRKKKG
jgi:SAM-dependent methyltransferase